MKGIFKTVLFTALISIASAMTAQETTPGSIFEGATAQVAPMIEQAKAKGLAGIKFGKEAFGLVATFTKQRFADISEYMMNMKNSEAPRNVMTSVAQFAKQGYSDISEYVIEHPGKSAALVTAAIAVPTAAYFAVKKAANYWKNRNAHNA